MTKPLSFLSIVLALAGCGGAGGPVETAATPELPAEAPRTTERAVRSPGKTSPPISVGYEILGRPAVGQPLEIRITARANATVEALTTQVRGGEGLYVAPASASFAVAQMRFGEPMSRALTVTPLREGVLRLSVLVEGRIDGEPQANTVSIPIRVGDAPQLPKPTGTVTSDESGEAIISLPAQQN